MNKTRTIGRGNAVRKLFGIAAAAALAGSVAVVNPVAAQNQPPSDLRTSLTASLAEHTLLAGNATAAILGNRPAEFQAASATLNQNSSRIAGLIGNLYGGNASGSFLPVWQRHIQYYADYANALKAGNDAGRQQASSNLMQWSVDMGTLLSAPAQFRSTAGDANAAGQSGTNTSNANSSQSGQMSNMSGNSSMVTQMMQQHVMDTMKVIDAQAANNWPQVYSLAAADVRHMKMVAQNLVSMHGNAVAYQGANADLKANVAMLLVENAALNANATSALLNDRIAEYQAASAALKDNTAALSSQLGTVYGGNAYSSINTAWNNQSLKLSQYANALARQDVDTQAAARSNVRGFTDEFANGFTQSNAQLPALTINGWGDTLSRFSINLIDAQDARNFATEYQLRAQTNQQLLQLTSVLGQSIGQQFPSQYGIPSAPAVPANVGSTNDNTSVASTNDAGTGATASTGGATTATGSADATGSTAGTVTSSGDASTADAGTVLLPTTGAALGSSALQVTGTTTATGTTGTAITSTTDITGTTGATSAGAAVTGTTGTTGTTTTGASSTGSVLLPQTGADLSSSAQQVTGTAATTDTTGAAITSTTDITGTTGATTAGAAVTGTTGTTGTTTTGASSTGSVLLPQTGADLSSSVQQVTGTTTTTDTTGITGAGTTATSTTTSGDASTTGSGVLLPQSGADLSQQQRATPNTFVPIAMVIAGIALIMAVVLMTFAKRDYRQQNRDH